MNNSTVCKPIINLTTFNLYSLIPSLSIMLFLACLERRVKLTNHCYGYPGLIIPVDFLRIDRNRFAHAAAFGATASVCIQLFERKFYVFNIAASSSDWLIMLNGFLTVIIIGTNYYPIFACLSTRHIVLGSVLGLLYSLSWIVVKLIVIIQCPNRIVTNYELVDIPGYLVISNIPEICCLAFIIWTFVRSLIVHWSRRQDENTENLKVAAIHQFAHVRYILKLSKAYYKNRHAAEKRDQTGGTTKFPKWFYKLRSEFKYPVRILATFLVAQIALFKISLVYGLSIYRMFEEWRIDFESSGFLQLTNNKSAASTARIRMLINQAMTIGQDSWVVSTVASALLMLFYTLHIMSCIRKHLLRLYCGSTSFIACRHGPVRTLANSLKYSSYQIGYILWGFLIMQIVLWLLCIFIAYFIILPIMDEIPPYLFNFLKSIWPSMAVSFLAYILQRVLAKYCFLLNGGKDGLVVDNRRFLCNITYFLFFYNIVLGIYSALLRLLESFFLGVLFVARMDRSLLIRGYETWDSGHDAYLGFLNMEFAHNHPATSVFCQLLLDSINESRCVNNPICINIPNTENSTDTSSNVAHLTTSKLARNRWHLAVTLINNSKLIDYRRPESCESTSSKFSADNGGYRDSDDDLLLLQD